MNRFVQSLLPVALCCAASLVHAQAPAEPHYLCGGIGSDESTRMRDDMKNHPLSMLFARPDGDYMANVQVRVTDDKGAQVLDWKADGPICVVDLPPGKYKLQASSGDTSRDHDVVVGKVPVRVDFRF